LKTNILQSVGRFLGYSREVEFACRFAEPVGMADSGNDLIADVLTRGIPIAVARLGFVEAAIILNYIEVRACSSPILLNRLKALIKGYRPEWDKNILSMAHKNAGVFPCEESAIHDFCSIYLQAFSEIDVMAAFGTIPGEKYLRSYCCPQSKLIPLESLEPFRFSAPWSSQLEGKKVLVIHPFAKSIQVQYRKRRVIFADARVLPECELKTIKAVQSIAGNSCGFGSWVDALRWMEDEMEKTDFDVCLVGAGAYGLPLAVHAKRLGKIAIHMGGALQLLFGIKGARWEAHVKDISELFNEHWVRADESERPARLETVEEGCYW